MQIAVVVSWLLAVIVAYFTNRVWVFNSGAVTKLELLREFISFMLARLATLVVEMVIIWFGVQLLNQDPIVWKIIDNIVVIILNYIISKLIVLKLGRYRPGNSDNWLLLNVLRHKRTAEMPSFCAIRIMICNRRNPAYLAHQPAQIALLLS